MFGFHYEAFTAERRQPLRDVMLGGVKPLGDGARIPAFRRSRTQEQERFKLSDRVNVLGDQLPDISRHGIV